jgi:hypothetical protein
MQSNIEFFTATCLNWQNLLSREKHMEIVLSRLKFLVEEERIWLLTSGWCYHQPKRKVAYSLHGIHIIMAVNLVVNDNTNHNRNNTK